MQSIFFQLSVAMSECRTVFGHVVLILHCIAVERMIKHTFECLGHSVLYSIIADHGGVHTWLFFLDVPEGVALVFRKRFALFNFLIVSLGFL